MKKNMIYQIRPWKQDLSRRKRLIEKYNKSEAFDDNFDRIYSTMEKEVYYSAFIIRKLIDCYDRVSNEVDNYKFKLKAVHPKKLIVMSYRSFYDENYDWNQAGTYTKSGKEICNWLIHSYVFFFHFDEKHIIDSFYVSSDYDKNKMLYQIDLKDWIAYMDFVIHDDIISMTLKVDVKEQDYVFVKKERENP